MRHLQKGKQKAKTSPLTTRTTEQSKHLSNT
jgi:hypothetical protein